jgi:ketosteroid isomerase-like protein
METDEMAITKEDVAGAMRDWVEANNAQDLSRLRSLEPEAIGFGYRTLNARLMGAISDDEFFGLMKEFNNNLGRYRMEMESLQTAVAGDVGLAWSFYVEDFQEKGMPPERVRVRFTQAMSKDASGWKVLQFHRDVQPFDEDGRYPRSLTAV